MTLEIRTLTVGPLEENCYLVLVPATRRLYVIDPGDEAERLIAEANAMPHESALVLLTHGHIDHLSAVGRVAAALQAPVYLRPEELPLYRSPANQILPWLPAATDLPEITATPDPAEVQVLALPGHTPGGAGFLFPAGPALFVGDTIFRESVGRTDLPGGSWPQLLRSIRTQIFPLPEELPLYPGHGPATTVGYEKNHNPYLQES